MLSPQWKAEEHVKDHEWIPCDDYGDWFLKSGNGAALSSETGHSYWVSAFLFAVGISIYKGICWDLDQQGWPKQEFFLNIS